MAVSVSSLRRGRCNSKNSDARSLQWSPAKVIFLFIRYMTIALQVSVSVANPEHGCGAVNLGWAIGGSIVMASVEYILILRVFALYPQNKLVRYTSVLLYVILLSALAIAIALGVPSIKSGDHCIVKEVPKVMMLTVLAPLVLQTVLFTLTSWKLAKALRNGWGKVPLVVVLLRDGTWAFFIVFGDCVYNPTIIHIS
ncbi:hypothetical protein FA15DRAFT_592102 [Coprinopsis marcescibilis]|uniref:G-protein coupled receptors family 3 profile domain-containing protein n=1 Tax=Coprinopsis marcescibilis TaxID=230819 RepID=A0A5C3KW83_COPMA|nr:hypothetical protein FA15DRAFT_592102 [Coprinopsis marcescibilis]